MSFVLAQKSSRHLNFLSLILLMAIPACHRGPARVALLTPFTGEIVGGTVYTETVLDGRSCGLGIHFDSPPREDDLSIQLSQFQQATKEHFDVIAIAPIQMRAFRNPVERAAQKGIPVIVIGDDLGIRNSNVAYVLPDEHLAGKLAADKIADLLHETGNVAVMGIDFGKPRNLIRERSFEEELSTNHKNIHVTQRINGTSNLFQEQQAAAELLDQPSPVNAIVALSASSTRGAFYAIKAKDSHPHVHLIGFDQGLVIPLIDRELDAVIGSTGEDIGRAVARLACDRANGREWRGPYTISPSVLTGTNYPSSDFNVQLGRQGWWKDEE